MEAVLMSIKPRFCELIASGKKTVEVRKTKPKLEVPFKCYIYCTNGKPILGRSLKDDSLKETPESDFDNYNRDTLFRANGKVIGEFVCDSTTPFRPKSLLGDSTIVKKSCVVLGKLIEYAPNKPFPEDHLYGWHISNLVIYDKPRELGEFKRVCDGNCQECRYAIWQTRNPYGDPIIVDCKPISVPQSWCYVWEETK
jgi:predicted transcriptional regulator